MAKNLVRKVFTANDTWVCPAGVKEVRASVFTKAQKIVSVGSNTFALLENGEIIASGSGSSGALGNNTTTTASSPVLVSGSRSYNQIARTCGLTDKGEMYCWGLNTSGQVGDNTTTSKSVPVLISGKTWRFISANTGFKLAIDYNGALYSWGSASNGVLGNNTTTPNISTPTAVSSALLWKYVSAGNSHCLGIDEDGNAWAWGSNSLGQLGDGSTNNTSSPILVSGSKKWVSVYAGTSASGGIDEDGNAWSWGNNTYGQLGDGTTNHSSTPRLVSGGKTWKVLAIGQSSAGIDKDGNGWSWGYNSEGQLGDGTTNHSSTPTAILGSLKLAAIETAPGGTTMLASTVDGVLYAWGENASGTIGDNSLTNRSSPVLVSVGANIPSYKNTVFVNSNNVKVTPGTSYNVTVFAPCLSVGPNPINKTIGNSYLILEYFA